MNDCISNILKSVIDNYNNYKSAKEFEAENKIILPLLNCLKWENNHFERQYHVRGRDGINSWLDFALLNDNVIPKIIIEAKRPAINFEVDYPEYPIEQLYNYVVVTKANMGILSNGFQWWFFLPPKKTKWRFKKVYEINILNNPISESIKDLKQFLYRENVISQKTWRIARKSVDKYFIDNTLMGITDKELTNKIELMRAKKDKNPKEKYKAVLLKSEAAQRKLENYY